MTRNRQWTLLVRYTGFLLAVFCLIGCAKSTKAKVSGTVTYKGTPLTNGVVSFYGQGNQVASCSIEPDGSYTVADAPVGPAQIAVAVPPDMKEPKGYKIPHAEGGSAKSVQIPRNYAEAEKSGLTYMVETGSQEHLIELK
jgi:hypothetical protein